MRLLAISPTLRFGGTEKYVLTIGQAAAARGWDVTALFGTERADEALFEKVRGLGLRPMAAGITDGGDRVRNQRVRFLRGLKILATVRPDAVLLAVPWPDRCLGLICACALRRVPTVVTSQLIPRPFRVSPRRRRAYTWARQRGQTWVAVSEYTRGLLCDAMGWARDDVVKTFNGAPLPPEPTDADRRAAREQILSEFRFAPDTDLMVTVGRPVPQKGYDRLIQAAAHVVRDRPQARFICIGEGPHRAEMQELARSYGVADQVLFVGHRDDVPTFLKGADLFVLPSLYEGLSIALAEAVAYGARIVSTDAASAPEIITDHEHGVLCRTDDSAALLEALRWALAHPREMTEMGRRARARAAEFGEDRMVAETMAALERTAGVAPVPGTAAAVQPVRP